MYVTLVCSYTAGLSKPDAFNDFVVVFGINL